MYFYKATGDEVDPISDNDELMHHYCENGINSLQYVRNSVGTHSPGSVFGAGGALGFLKDRLAGVEAPRGCTIHDVGLFTLDWKNLKGFGLEIWGFIKVVIEGEIG